MIEFKNFGLIDCPVLDTTSVPDNHIRNAYVPDKPIRNSYYHDVRQNVQDRMFIMDSRGTPTNPAKLHQIQPKNPPDLRKNPPLQIIYRNGFEGYSRTSKSADRPRSTITDIDVKSKSKPKQSERKSVYQIKPELRNQIYEQPTSLPVHIRCVMNIIYIIKQDIHTYKYVPYSRPNGWTKWAEFFLWTLRGFRGVS